MSKIVRFIPHAEAKFVILSRQGFKLTREQVIDVALNPDTIEQQGYRKLARKVISASYHLNVVLTEDVENITIIMFFPSLRTRHEPESNL